MASDKLNERQEKFCQAIMQGKTQRQAYYSAYPSSEKWKPENVDARASNLINSNKVLARIKFLRNEAESQNEITRNDLLEQLKSIGFYNIDLENIKISDKLKAIELMTKILGYDKPEPITANNNLINDSIIAIADLIRNPKPNRELPDKEGDSD